jgi:acetoacetate decarboxylase
MQGEVILTDSPLDPVADIPVRRLLRMEYEEGRTQSNGKVLRSIPGDWLLPFLHQRYDDTSGDGIEV